MSFTPSDFARNDLSANRQAGVVVHFTFESDVFGDSILTAENIFHNFSGFSAGCNLKWCGEVRFFSALSIV